MDVNICFVEVGNLIQHSNLVSYSYTMLFVSFVYFTSCKHMEIIL